MASPFSARAYRGFPPGRAFLLLPARPSRALHAGLALYDGVLPMQQAALAVGRCLARARLGALLGSVSGGSVAGGTAGGGTVDWAWWDAWIAEVGAVAVGKVGHVALRVPPNGRVSVLLLAGDGRPLGFVKLLDVASPAFSAAVRELLTAAPLRFVRVPRTIAEGQFRERRYVLFEPLPEGPHRRPPFDPPRLAAVVDELTARLAALPRLAGVPAHHVVSHSGLTPRNLRVGADGAWWLYDWDYVRWAPPAAAEMRYWCADFAYRLRVVVPRAARRIVAILRGRFGDGEIHEAATWPGALRTYRAVEGEIRSAVAALTAPAPRPG